MKRHIWFQGACVSCEQPRTAALEAAPCPGPPGQDPQPAEPARPAPASPELEHV